MSMKRSMISLASIMMVAVIAIAGQVQPPNQDEKKDAIKLEGTYTIVKGEADGQDLPEDKFKQSLVKFTSNKVIGVDKEKNEIFAAVYKLDQSSKPCKIMLTTTIPETKREVQSTGLVKKEGDMIVLIYALPGGKEPTEFKTSEKQNMFWMKPIKSDSDR